MTEINNTLFTALNQEVDSTFEGTLEDDYLGWHLHYLRHNGFVYQTFRTIADRFATAYGVVPVRAVFELMRYPLALTDLNESVVSGSEKPIRLNHVVTPLFGRLYRIERPFAKVSLRRALWDACNDEEWDKVLGVFEPLRDHRYACVDPYKVRFTDGLYLERAA